MLATVNNAAMNMGVQITLPDRGLIAVGQTSGSGIAASCGSSILILSFNFGGNPTLFSTVVGIIYILTNSAQAFLFSTASPTLFIF